MNAAPHGHMADGGSQKSRLVTHKPQVSGTRLKHE